MLMCWGNAALQTQKIMGRFQIWESLTKQNEENLHLIKYLHHLTWLILMWNSSSFTLSCHAIGVSFIIYKEKVVKTTNETVLFNSLSFLSFLFTLFTQSKCWKGYCTGDRTCIRLGYMANFSQCLMFKKHKCCILRSCRNSERSFCDASPYLNLN